MIPRLEEHEAFLRAIFDAPDDDTPRLVYADFLDDHGFPDRAELIRVQCERERRYPPDNESVDTNDPIFDRERRAFDRAFPWVQPPYGEFRATLRRGLWVPYGGLQVTAGQLADPAAVREHAVRHAPGWFGETRLSVGRDRPLGADEVNALFELPFTQQVTEWDLGGRVEEVVAGPDTEDGGAFGLIDLEVRPAVTVRGVEALANHRGARRVRVLNLTNNRLDNDAVRALTRSPHLIRLERLDLYDGATNFRGDVWARLRDRFGEKVVG